MTSSLVLRIPLVSTSVRFQPTGFPDLGAATFQAPDGKGGWVPSVHLESPQSMGNRLELTTWDLATEDQVSELTGLPYVRIVNSDGEFLTSSRLEAHRLASAYVMNARHGDTSGRDWLEKTLDVQKDKALNHHALAKAIFRLDPVSLIHGVFFAQGKWAWQPKIARALTCFIDAFDVRTAVSGGVKTDSVNPKSEKGRDSSEGYGMVPHQRVEYTAQRIEAVVVVDRAQITSYGLSEAAEKVLFALIDFELAQLFRSGSLRLRTACMLEVAPEATDLDQIPTVDDATAAVREAISNAAGELGEVTELVWGK